MVMSALTSVLHSLSSFLMRTDTIYQWIRVIRIPSELMSELHYSEWMQILMLHGINVIELTSTLIGLLSHAIYKHLSISQCISVLTS